MKSIIVRAVILCFVVLAISAFLIDWNVLTRPGGRRDTDDAQLRGDQIQLAAEVAGNLVQVPVKDYQAVHAGDLLFQIDPADYLARVASAEAAVAGAKAAVAEAEAKLSLQTMTIAASAADVKVAQADYVRSHLEKLRQDSFKDTESYQARSWEDASSAEAHQAATVSGQQHALAAAHAETDVLQAQLTQSRQSVERAEAALKLAQIQLGYTRITAPVDGVVTERQARLGEYVTPGRVLLTLVPLQPIWAVANYREIQLTHMRVGQPADVTVDALPGIVLHGHIDSFEPTSEASSSRLPPDRAVGNFTKIVQRVPVKILIDPPKDLLGLLKPGLSVETHVYTDGIRE